MAAAGALLTLMDALAAIVAGLALLALAMFTIVPACQLMIPALVARDRGTATSLHLTVYYVLGALGGVVPGLLLDRGWGWLVASCIAAQAVALTAALALRSRLRA